MKIDNTAPSYQFGTEGSAKPAQKASHLHESWVQAFDAETYGPLDGSMRDIRDAYSRAVAYVSTIEDIYVANNKRKAAAEADKATLGSIDRTRANVLQQMDTALQKSQRQLEAMEKDVQQSAMRAESWRWASATRDHVASMKTTSERYDFVMERLKAGETDAALAVLMAPGYLTGLSPESSKALHEAYLDVAHPGYRARRDNLTAARDQLMKAGTELIKHTDLLGNRRGVRDRLLEQKALDDLEARLK